MRRWEPFVWWGVLACGFLMEYYKGTDKVPVFDAMGSAMLIFVGLFGKNNNLVIAWYILFLGIGKAFDAIQYPYLQIDHNVAEIVNIIFSTIGAIILWIRRNYHHDTTT